MKRDFYKYYLEYVRGLKKTQTLLLNPLSLDESVQEKFCIRNISERSTKIIREFG